MPYTEAQFRATDGVELRGRLYAAEKLGPGVVMCPGFNCVLTMLNLPACASALQERGISVLLYDPRSTGSSGGQPRNDIDPSQAVGDMSDALSHLSTLVFVDASQMGLFGISFGGTVALTASTIDPRSCFTIAVAPLSDLDFKSPAQRLRVLQKCMKDRESQVLGNPPISVPVINEKGENPVGFGHGIDKERYGKLVSQGKEIAPGHVNRVTLMTYYRLAMWTPWPLWRCLGLEMAEDGKKKCGHGVLMIVPGKDEMSYPELQRKHFDDLGDEKGCIKQKIEIEEAGHEDILGEEYLATVVNGAVAFLRDILNTEI